MLTIDGKWDCSHHVLRGVADPHRPEAHVSIKGRFEPVVANLRTNGPARRWTSWCPPSFSRRRLDPER